MAVRGAFRAASRASADDVGRIASRSTAPSQLLQRSVIVLLVSSLGAGTAFATQTSLPDEPLYAAKLACEQLRLDLAREPEQRVAVLLDIADARLHEAAELQAQQRDADAGAAVSAYGENVAQAASQVQDVVAAAPAAAVEFRTAVLRQQAGIVAAAEREAGPVAIALEIRSTLVREREAAPHEIAALAASIADKAAVSVEQKLAQVTPTTAAASQPPVTPNPLWARSVGASTPASASTSAGTPAPGAAAVAATPSASAIENARPRETNETPSHDPEPREPGPPANAGAKATADDPKRIEAAARAARESAERAQQAADQARESSVKSSRDKGK